MLNIKLKYQSFLHPNIVTQTTTVWMLLDSHKAARPNNNGKTPELPIVRLDPTEKTFSSPSMWTQEEVSQVSILWPQELSDK